MKSFECPMSIRNYEKIMLGTSDASSVSWSSNQPSEPPYYIEDCQISKKGLPICLIYKKITAAPNRFCP